MGTLIKIVTSEPARMIGRAALSAALEVAIKVVKK